jgi:D-3-phosphoglycerate dehydrogenase
MGRMTPKSVVMVTSRSFSTGDVNVRADLESVGANVVTAPSDHNLNALRPVLAETVAWIAGTGPITAEHLAAAPKLRVIARYGVGVDAVDLEAAARHQVMVTNTPGANTGAVADHTLALMLAALRDVTAGDRGVRSGNWQVNRTRELSSLTIGIVGLGRIGRGVATRLSGYGGVILGHDPWVSDAQARTAGIEPVGLDELAARCDIVTLHAPGDQILVNGPWLARARPGLILVNTARANLVDEPALAQALRSGAVRRYAADSLSTETGHGGGSPLLAADLIDKTIFTPHSAAQTVQAVDGMGIGAAAAVLAVLRGETPPNLVVITPSQGSEL